MSGIPEEKETRSGEKDSIKIVHVPFSEIQKQESEHGVGIPRGNVHMALAFPVVKPSSCVLFHSIADGNAHIMFPFRVEKET